MLPLGLNPFGNHIQPHALAQCDNGAGNGGVIGIHQHVAHKRLINLQLIQRQSLEVGQ